MAKKFKTFESRLDEALGDIGEPIKANWSIATVVAYWKDTNQRYAFWRLFGNHDTGEVFTNSYPSEKPKVIGHATIDEFNDWVKSNFKGTKLNYKFDFIAGFGGIQEKFQEFLKMPSATFHKTN